MAFFNPIITLNGPTLPFANVSNGSSTLPFLTISPAPLAQAPFYTQASNVIQFGADCVTIDFI